MREFSEYSNPEAQDYDIKSSLKQESPVTPPTDPVEIEEGIDLNEGSQEANEEVATETEEGIDLNAI